MTRRFAVLLCGALVMVVAESAYAAASDPAAVQVQTLTASLLKSMQGGSAVSMTERYRNLEPVIQKTFALPLMTRICVGPDWASLSPEQQRALIAAFTRFTIANYAYNFHDSGGKRFEIDDNVLSRDKEKFVQTRLISSDESPARLLYRMRQVDGTWKIVDVLYNGVSELTLRRSDCSAAMSSGGAPALIAHLHKASDSLMKE